jgi:hypothetical protein
MHFQKQLSFVLGGLAAAFVVLAPSLAQAKPIAACGNIDFSGASNLSCNFVTSGGCTSQCTPVSCTASVSAMCNGSASATCSGSCSGTCGAKCKVDPGTFSCSGECVTECGGSCSTNCKGNADETTCVTQCKASCSNQCDISCNGTAPSATCTAKCDATCNGSCTAQANLDCQEMATGDCTGGCTAACSSITGALFCDFGNGLGSQYVDVAVTDLPACVSAIESSANIKIAGGGSVTCTGNTCSASGALAATGCAVSSPGSSGALPVGGVALGFGLALATAARRRRSS